VLSLGPLAFAAPWLLLGLVALPLLWWLLRVVPPAPLRVRFPAIRLLLGLTTEDQAAAKTPWWLVVLRLALAAAAVLALAHPLLRPQATLTGAGPLVLAVDDGWAAAPDWPNRLAMLDALLAQAERDGRAVQILTTAPDLQGGPPAVLGLMPAGEARALARALEPKPWPSDRPGALRALAAATPQDPVEVVWLADGLDDGSTRPFAEALAALGPATLMRPAETVQPLVLLPPATRGRALALDLMRAEGAGEAPAWVRASDADGALVARALATFAPGESTATAVFDLPAEMRNRIVRVDIEGHRSAAATVLLDDRWQRRPVGLVSGGPLERDQPLLSDIYYVERALEPFTELRVGELEALMADPPAVIVLADVAKVPGDLVPQVAAWIEAGGVLVRFAGPRFAEGADALVPVQLRGGGRMVGGAMSWDQPLRLAPFDAKSPFAGLVPPNEVLVARQVLAEPNLDLPRKTWARMTDGTPLVTAERQGDGWLVLVHTTANTTWTNLPISGLFVEMLQRLVELSAGVPGQGQGEPLPPFRALDGFGVLGAPAAAARPLAPAEIATTVPGPIHPPGTYGSEETRRALNLGPALGALARFADVPDGMTQTAFETAREVDLQPWLLALAVALALAELMGSLVARGQLVRPRLGAAAPAVAACLALVAQPVHAQVDDDYALLATGEVHLAYVRTGDRGVDEIARSGLFGLSTILHNRTSVEPADPMAVDLETDELIFFPMVYWPMTAGQAELSDRARAKIDHYLKTGGILVLDTRDPDATLGGGTGQGSQTLRRLLAGLSLPPLVPVPPDHVLTRAFYLIEDFPGRWTGDQVWVEQIEGSHNDGVSSVVIGSHDWAAAWAMDPTLEPLLPVVPGGERQREMAYRFGVNLVMYALTGNYKADAVHVPTILERLGQ